MRNKKKSSFPSANALNVHRCSKNNSKHYLILFIFKFQTAKLNQMIRKIHIRFKICPTIKVEQNRIHHFQRINLKSKKLINKLKNHRLIKIIKYCKISQVLQPTNQINPQPINQTILTKVVRIKLIKANKIQHLKNKNKAISKIIACIKITIRHKTLKKI